MSRFVTISTFGTPPPAYQEDNSFEKNVDNVIEFWSGKLDYVLIDKPDLIHIPEWCDIPVGLPVELKEEYLKVRGNRVRDYMMQVARVNKCYVVYSSLTAISDGRYYNSTILIDRNGDEAGIYCKNHVVIHEHSDWNVEYGNDVPIIECDFGRVACAICFDLNFDEIRTKIAVGKPDIILFSSMFHGGLMQSYWAYSCRAHFVAALYGKPSAIIRPTGDIVASTTNYFDYVTATINLDCCLFHSDWNRPKLEAAKAKYGRKLDLHDPGFLGSFLLSSNSDELKIADVIKEFELESLDDYLARSLAHKDRVCYQE